MKILVACDSFKGCMNSYEACHRVKAGLAKANPNWKIQMFPMSDGGEGFAHILGKYIHADTIQVATYDLLGNPIWAQYAYNKKEKLAIMDVASCIGLNLCSKEQRNPMLASSYGVGLMMQDAFQRGCRKLVIGLGGSGTNDGGMGILEAFGAKFFNRKRERLEDNAYNLERIAFIDKRSFHFPKNVEIIVGCDVKIHLLGEKGATYMFGRQKGVYPSQMKALDEGMRIYNEKVEQTFHVDMNAFEGSGAAGGIGGVLLGVFQAQMIPGIELAIHYAKFKEALKKADFVISGEGQTDAQTLYGKVCFGIAREAKKMNVPTICLSGALGKGYEPLYREGVIGIFSSADRAMDFKTALATGKEKLENLAFSIGKLVEGVEEMYEKKNR